MLRAFCHHVVTCCDMLGVVGSNLKMVKFFMQHCGRLARFAFSSPEPTILLACGRNRELWEQPFQPCAIDADCVKPDGQNSVISFVISKWLLPELSIPAADQKDRRLWERECQVRATMLRLGMRTSSISTRNMWQHVATGWPNARNNATRPTM